MYTHVVCKKTYYSPLDRSFALAIEGRTYVVRKALAEGFYALICEGGLAIGIQVTDVDFDFIVK
jgi:hypothetical protein